jgi:hypothetical protein
MKVKTGISIPGTGKKKETILPNPRRTEDGPICSGTECRLYCVFMSGGTCNSGQMVFVGDVCRMWAKAVFRTLGLGHWITTDQWMSCYVEDREDENET